MVRLLRGVLMAGSSVLQKRIAAAALTILCLSSHVLHYQGMSLWVKCLGFSKCSFVAYVSHARQNFASSRFSIQECEDGYASMCPSAVTGHKLGAGTHLSCIIRTSGKQVNMQGRAQETSNITQSVVLRPYHLHRPQVPS